MAEFGTLLSDLEKKPQQARGAAQQKENSLLEHLKDKKERLEGRLEAVKDTIHRLEQHPEFERFMQTLDKIASY